MVDKNRNPLLNSDLLLRFRQFTTAALEKASSFKTRGVPGESAVVFQNSGRLPNLRGPRHLCGAGTYGSETIYAISVAREMQLNRNRLRRNQAPKTHRFR